MFDVMVDIKDFREIPFKCHSTLVRQQQKGGEKDEKNEHSQFYTL